MELRLGENRLTIVPAEIWQLTSLTELVLDGNQLTIVPAEIGQLTSLEVEPRQQSADGLRQTSGSSRRW